MFSKTSETLTQETDPQTQLVRDKRTARFDKKTSVTPPFPSINPVHRFLLGVDAALGLPDLLDGTSGLAPDLPVSPNRLDWFRVFQYAIFLIISDAYTRHYPDRTRDILGYFLEQSEATKARFYLAKNPDHLVVWDKTYDAYAKDGQRVSDIVIDVLATAYPILQKLGRGPDFLRHYFNPIVTNEIDKITALYQHPNDPDLLEVVVYMLDLRSQQEIDSDVFYSDYQKYFSKNLVDGESYKRCISKKLIEFNTQFNLFQTVYKEDQYTNQLSRYRPILMPIPLKVLRDRPIHAIDQKIGLMTNSYRFFSSELRGILRLDSKEIRILPEDQFEVISEDSFWTALTGFLNYCDHYQKWDRDIKSKFEDYLSTVKAVLQTTRDVSALDRLAAYKSFLNASEHVNNPPQTCTLEVAGKLRDLTSEPSTLGRWFSTQGDVQTLFNVYVMGAIERRLEVAKKAKADLGDKIGIQKLKDYFYTLHDTIERTVAYCAFDREEIIEGFYTLNKDNDDIQNLPERPNPQDLDTTAIVQRYRDIFAQKLIDFLQYNQTLGLHLINAMPDRDFIGQFGSGQGKSVLIGLSAMNEIKRLLETYPDRSGVYVIVLTSYNYLAKNDHRQMTPFYDSPNNPNGGQIPSMHLHAVTQFDSGFPRWGIVHADTKMFTLIVRQLFLKVVAGQATSSHAHFLKAIYGAERCSLILDECDLLMHDLQTVDLNGPIDVGPYFSKQTLLRFLADTNRKNTKLETLLRAPYPSSDLMSTDDFDGRKYKVVRLCEGDLERPTVRMYPGCFSLTEFLKGVSRVIGVSATVKEATEIRQKRPNKGVQYFKIPLFHNPTVSETQVPLLGVERILGSQSDWADAIIHTMGTVYAETPAHRRPILIFLAHDIPSDWTALKTRIATTFQTTVTEYKEESDVTEDGIQKTGQIGQITLATGVLGRGADIRPPKGVDIHVIIGFKPKKEIEIQMRGRTCRMGRGGSYSHITYQDHHQHAQGLSGYDPQVTETKHQETKAFLDRHQYSLPALATHGSSQMIDWVEPHIARDRVLICVDGTGSMNSVFASLKTKVKNFLTGYLRQQDTSGQSRIEFQIMIYRSTSNYQQGEAIECSAWSSSTDVLFRDFFDTQQTAGGYPRGEALALALYHIKVQAKRGGLNRAIIIGDDFDEKWAKPNAPEQCFTIRTADSDVDSPDSTTKITTGNYRTLLHEIQAMHIPIDCFCTARAQEVIEKFQQISRDAGAGGSYVGFDPNREDLSALIEGSVDTAIRSGDVF